LFVEVKTEAYQWFHLRHHSSDLAWYTIRQNLEHFWILTILEQIYINMPSVSDYKAYHILSYGSFLGATLFQSFIGGVVAFKVLPRAQFSTLQKATFPVFFTLQSVLGLALMLTYPGEKLLGVGNQYIRQNVGFSGLLVDSNRWPIFVPLATIFVTSVLNALVIGPATTKTMKERHHQGSGEILSLTLSRIHWHLLETRDGKKYSDPGPHSKAMEQLNKSFGILHSVSTIINLTAFGCAIWYGFILGERL
jgi:hypothetical protein